MISIYTPTSHEPVPGLQPTGIRAASLHLGLLRLGNQNYLLLSWCHFSFVKGLNGFSPISLVSPCLENGAAMDSCSSIVFSWPWSELFGHNVSDIVEKSFWTSEQRSLTSIWIKVYTSNSCRLRTYCSRQTRPRKRLQDVPTCRHLDECTGPVKSVDTPTHSRFFLYFYYFLHCRIIVETSKLWKKTHMESCSNQESVKQIKIYLRFFKVAALRALHTLGILSTSFMR